MAVRFGLPVMNPVCVQQQKGDAVKLIMLSYQVWLACGAPELTNYNYETKCGTAWVVS